jgi:hypothetical protein
MKQHFQNKYFTFLVIFFTTQIITIAQEKRTTISFEYYTHDFGTIKEDGGKVAYDFMFTNAGNASLIIKSVSASCGCTVPHWPKEPILPGNSGKISVEFDPMNKPGAFSKTLTVFSNTLQDGTILTLMGKVIPKPRKPQDEFPDIIGGLRMVSRYMNLGEITTEKWQRKYFEIFNQTDTVININNIEFNPAYLNVKVEPSAIPAKSKAKITVEMSPKWKNDFGYTQDKIELVSNDKTEPKKTLFATAYITMFFPEMTPEEKLKQPKIEIDKKFHDFGLIKQGDKGNVSFNIKNTGVNELQIIKIKPSCGCTVADTPKKTLKQGEETKLNVVFDSQGKDGIQEKIINIYTNDPNNHNVVITLKAKIQK